MSFGDSYSTYQFSFDAEGSSGASSEGQFTLSSKIGIDDSFAFGLLAALNGASWPSGMMAPFVVIKRDFDDTLYTTDLTTSPPSFT